MENKRDLSVPMSRANVIVMFISLPVVIIQFVGFIVRHGLDGLGITWGYPVLLIAIVLGGSQALSRSLFSRMIPEGKEASFFGLYEVSERGTSWMGPLLFSIVIARTGSYRQALLSLIFFFVVGLILLAITNTDKAIHEAKSEASPAV